MSKSFETYQALLYGFNPSRSSVCSLKSGIFCFSWTEFIQVTTGKGTELFLTTFCMSVPSVTGKRMLISDYNCVCGHLSLQFHCYPYLKAMLVNKKTHYGLLLDSLFIFDLKSALILIRLPELHFSWYDFYLSTINLLLKWLTVSYLQVTFESQILTQQTWLKVDDFQSLVLPYLYLMYYWYFRFKPIPFLFSFFHFRSLFFSYFGLCFYALK